MKHASPQKTKRFFLLSATLAILAMQGCKWDDSLYERYVGDRDAIEPCKGICLSEDIPQDEGECKARGYIWTDKYCILGDQYLNAKDEASCNHQNGTWFKGECKILDEATCDKIGGIWVAFQLYDIGNGQYLRVKDGKYYCGSFEQVSDGSAKECTDMSSYVEDITYGLCYKTLFCRSVKMNDEDVATCTSCPTNEINCGGGKCADLSIHPEHCGKCGNRCPSDQFCSNGKCEAQSTECNPQDSIPCLDTNNKLQCLPKFANESCGTKECTNKEEGQYCKCEDIILGDVCEGNLICDRHSGCVCPDGLFLDPTNDSQCNAPNDRNHCGASIENPSGTKCRDDQLCNGKECVCREGIECDGECIDPLNNHDYCGLEAECSLLTTCRDDEVCKQGVCVCADPNKANCDGACIDKDTSTHCGANGLCNSDLIDSVDFKGYNCKAVHSSSQCVNIDGSYLCTCESGYTFDGNKIPPDCVDSLSNKNACGTNSNNLIDCELYYGKDARCVQGVCECKNSDWLKIDDTLAWYHSLPNKRFRCVNVKTDNRFCGANTGSRGQICGEGTTCIDGVCSSLGECSSTGQRLCVNHCYYFLQAHIKSCDGGCQDNYCSFENDYLVEGCQGTPKLTCDCGEDAVLVDYGQFKKCLSVDKLHEMHISIEDGYTSKFVCAQGWSDNQRDKHHGDGSLLIVDNEVCNINIFSDVNHCGAIGNVCANTDDLNRTAPSCERGECKYNTCKPEYDNCDKDDSNGCETPLTTVDNCGVCKVKCNKSRTCHNGLCCLAEGTITDDVKSYDCCPELKKYKKCILDMGFLGCWNYDYQCASSQPDGWDEM